MSKNISIDEGGQSRQFGHINKLKIAQSGGGDTLWVPEDEVQTQTLFVDKNGMYDAHAGTYTEVIVTTKKKKNGKKKKTTTYITSYDEDLLCYGWDEVSVNIIDAVDGKDSEGNEHHIGVTDGYLTDEKIPSYIEIVTPPDKTSYIVAQPIDTKGMVVKAYYADGTEWGEIPREDYTIDPMVAPIDQNLNKYSKNGVNAIKAHGFSAEGTEVWNGNIIHIGMQVGTYNGYPAYIYIPDYNWQQGVESFYNTIFTAYDGKLFFNGLNGKDGAGCSYLITYNDGSYQSGGTGGGRGGLWVEVPYITPSASIPISTTNPASITITDDDKVSDDKATITVKWPRPADALELTDTFEIEVRDPTPAIGETGNGGSGGGSW